MQSNQTYRSWSVIRSGLIATFVFVFCAGCIGPSPHAGTITPYDNRCEAPFPPEAIAHLLDMVIKNHPSDVTLTLVRHPEPSTQSEDARAAWVCTVNGKPLWVIYTAPKMRRDSSGLTTRALQRARAFVAEENELKRELNGKARSLGWHPKKDSLLPAYQSREYGLQLTQIRLIDRQAESWTITAAPIRESLGGKVRMRFDKEHKVSAESK